MWVGFNQTRELKVPEGYDLIDYDYDKTDFSEYETYFYVNNTKVNINDVNDFRKVIEQKDNLITKRLIP